MPRLCFPTAIGLIGIDMAGRGGGGEGSIGSGAAAQISAQCLALLSQLCVMMWCKSGRHFEFLGRGCVRYVLSKRKTAIL